MVREFLSERVDLARLPAPTFEAAAQLLSPGVARRLDPASTLTDITGKAWSLLSFAQRPLVTEEEIRAKKIDLLVLSFMGFLHVKEGRFALASYADDDEQFLLAMNRLQSWCPLIDMEELRAAVPRAGIGPVALNADAASAAVRALKDLAEGRVVDVSAYSRIYSPDAVDVALPSQIAQASQLDNCHGVHELLGDHARGHARDAGLTQGEHTDPESEESGGNAEPAGRLRKRRRMREEHRLAAEDFQDNVTLAKKVATSLCVTACSDMAINRLKDMFKSDGTPCNIEVATTLVFKLFHELGLATRSVRGKSIVLQAVPGENAEHVVQGLSKLLGLNEAKMAQTKSALSSRALCPRFTVEAFNDVVLRMGQTLSR